jgi:DedD protein
MDEVVLRRVVGVVTLAIAAFLLSWLLPRPGLDRLRGEGERVVTVDLTRPDSRPREILPPLPEEAAAVEPQPARTAQPVAAPVPEPAATETPAPEAPERAKPEPAKPAEPARRAGAPKPAAKPAETRPAESKPAEPAKPEPSKPAEPEPARPAAKAPAVTSSGGGAGEVMVQAGAYSSLDRARAVHERAGAKGQHCVISPAETSKGTLYRLRCGPYADRTAAQAAAKTLTAAGIAAQVVGAGR